MQDKENITIIIATHNNAKTIERALNSVTSGIRPADQVTIGDNDSSDGTYEVLCDILGAKNVTINDKTGLPPQFDGMMNNIPVKIFRKKRTTTGNIVNTAMQLKWKDVTIFGYMEPTSWYAFDKIAQAVRILNIQQTVACVVSDYDNHNIDGRIERIFKSSFDMQRFMLDYPYDRNFLVRTQVFTKLKSGFNDQMPIRDDYDFLLRTSEVGLIYHIPAPLHHNTISEIDQTTQDLIKQCEESARQMAAQRRNPDNV